MEHMAAQMDSQIEGAISENERLLRENEMLRTEIERLLASRSTEGDRLDWLLHNLPGNVLRDLVGEMSDTGDVGEWRAAIDRAAGFPPSNTD